MSLALYMDVHIPRVITLALRMRGVDIVTAQEDGRENQSDAELLERATELGRVVFTFDDDFLRETAKKGQEDRAFSGVIYAHPLRISIGQCVNDLELIAKAGEPEDLKNRVIFLPL